MRILITGAGGFLGAHTAVRLAARGHDVVPTARRALPVPVFAPLPGPHATAAASLTTLPADLARDDLSPLLAGCDAVVHCAARASPWGPREIFWRDNVVATERLLKAAAHAATVRRFVHISTPSIYFDGRPQHDRTEEFTPPRRWPTAYAESKWTAEERVRAARSLGPVILRPRAVFGPGDRAIVPRIVAAAARGYLPLPGGGTASIDITYVDNVVDSIEAALAAPRTLEGRAFNVTNGEPVVVRDLLTRLFAALHLDVKLVNVPRTLALAAASFSEALAKLRPRQPEPRLTKYGVGLLATSQTLSIAAAREALGFEPAVSVADGLERYARWWKTQ